MAPSCVLQACCSSHVASMVEFFSQGTRNRRIDFPVKPSIVFPQRGSSSTHAFHMCRRFLLHALRNAVGRCTKSPEDSEHVSKDSAD